MYVYPPVLLLSNVLLKNQEGLCLRDPCITGLASSAYFSTLLTLSASPPLTLLPELDLISQEQGCLLHPNLAALHHALWTLHG